MTQQPRHEPMTDLRALAESLAEKHDSTCHAVRRQDRNPGWQSVCDCVRKRSIAAILAALSRVREEAQQELQDAFREVGPKASSDHCPCCGPLALCAAHSRMSEKDAEIARLKHEEARWNRNWLACTVEKRAEHEGRMDALTQGHQACRERDDAKAVRDKALGRVDDAEAALAAMTAERDALQAVAVDDGAEGMFGAKALTERNILQARVQALEAEFECRDTYRHYCGRCDNSIGPKERLSWEEQAEPTS